jgi:hypothetical protein
MGMIFGIIMAARAHAIRGGAIPVLMNMEGMLLAWVKSLNVRDDFHFFSVLSEGDLSLTLVAGGWVQHSHALFHGGPRLGMGGTVVRSADNGSSGK